MAKIKFLLAKNSLHSRWACFLNISLKLNKLLRMNFFLNIVLKNEDILLPKIEQAFENELFP